MCECDTAFCGCLHFTVFDAVILSALLPCVVVLYTMYCILYTIYCLLYVSHLYTPLATRVNSKHASLAH